MRHRCRYRLDRMPWSSRYLFICDGCQTMYAVLKDTFWGRG